MSAARGLMSIQRHPAVAGVYSLRGQDGTPQALVNVKRAGGLWLAWVRPSHRLMEDAVEWWKAHDRTGAPGVVVDSIEEAEAAVAAFSMGQSLRPWSWRQFAPGGVAVLNDGRTT